MHPKLNLSKVPVITIHYLSQTTVYKLRFGHEKQLINGKRYHPKNLDWSSVNTIFLETLEYDQTM